MDNAPSQPKSVNESNLKIVFLLANTTKKLQPPDHAVIKTIKTIYRKRLARSVLSKMDEAEDVKTPAKSVSVLHALHWIDTTIREHCSSTVK